MKSGVFSTLAVFVVKKSLVGIIADAGIKTTAIAKKNINEPHKNIEGLRRCAPCCGGWNKSAHGFLISKLLFLYQISLKQIGYYFNPSFLATSSETPELYLVNLYSVYLFTTSTIF